MTQPPASPFRGHGARLRRGLALAVLAAAAAALPAQAGTAESERANLTIIANELAHVQALVSRAAMDAPPSQRVNFHYEWLQRDLELLREGIRQHLDAPRQPRPVPPLTGDYRE